MTRDPIPRWLLAILCGAAAIVLAPFAPWVVLAVWLGLYAERIYNPILKRLGGRSALSATLTVLLLLVIVVPLAALVASLVVDAIALVQRLAASEQGKSILEQLAGGDDPGKPHRDMMSLQGLTDLLMSQGERAFAIARQVAGAAARVVIGLLILVSGIYGVLVEGKGWYEWIERHATVRKETVARLAAAFVETGRGMAYGVFGAGLIQSVVATVTYVILGVPSALALGMLTLMFSVIPAIGTAIVWGPVAAGLALTGRTGAAIALAIIGLGVIGTVDNVARPWLAKRGQLQLPTYVVLVSMFGGIALIGGWGLVLGPLVVRLAKEALLIRSEAVVTPDPP